MNNEFEKYLSLEISRNYQQVLISSLILRRSSCGQVDLAYFDGEALVVVEAKSSPVGLCAMQRSQLCRLRSSCQYLSILLRRQVVLKVFVKKKLVT